MESLWIQREGFCFCGASSLNVLFLLEKCSLKTFYVIMQKKKKTAVCLRLFLWGLVDIFYSMDYPTIEGINFCLPQCPVLIKLSVNIGWINNFDEFYVIATDST